MLLECEAQGKAKWGEGCRSVLALLPWPETGVGRDRRIPEAWHMPRRIKTPISKKGKGKN